MISVRRLLGLSDNQCHFSGASGSGETGLVVSVLTMMRPISYPAITKEVRGHRIRACTSTRSCGVSIDATKPPSARTSVPCHEARTG